MNAAEVAEARAMLLDLRGRVMKLAEAASDVVDSWEIEGRSPPFHRRARMRLIREWPVLAQAVMKLSEVVQDELKESKMNEQEQEQIESAVVDPQEAERIGLEADLVEARKQIAALELERERWVNMPYVDHEEFQVTLAKSLLERIANPPMVIYGDREAEYDFKVIGTVSHMHYAPLVDEVKKVLVDGWMLHSIVNSPLIVTASFSADDPPHPMYLIITFRWKS